MEKFKTLETNKKNEIPLQKNFEQVPAFEERYKKELLPLLEALCPENESFDEFEQRTKNDLEESAKKVQVAQGKLIEYDENKTFEKMKEILVSRIKAVLEDERQFRYKKEKYRPDQDLVLRSKIALLLAGDFSDLQSSKSEVPIEKMNHEILTWYLGIYSGSKKKKLNEKELDELVRAGLGKQLATMQTSYFSEKLENVPESLLLEMIKQNDGFWVNNILEYHASKNGYSDRVLNELILNGNAYVAMKNIEKFNNLNIDIVKSLVMSYGPEYPYHLRDVLEELEKLKWEEDDKKEIIDFAFKHQNIAREDKFNEISDVETKGEYRKIYEEIRNLVTTEEKRWDPILPEKLPKENLDKLKKYIEDGHITFFHEFHEYVKYFYENDYEWLKEQVIKNNQENLLLNTASYGLFKPEDQEIYAQKLIKQNKIDIVKILIAEHHFLDGSLSQGIFEKLLEHNFIMELDCFNNLNETSFLHLLKNKFNSWGEVEGSLSHFSLPDGCLAKKIMEEITQKTSDIELRFYYVKNFLDVDKEKREKILNLIEETQSFKCSFDFVKLYIEKFSDNSTKKEREDFIKKFNEYVENISKNKIIECSDSEEYRMACEVVYPKRNYDTYQYIDEYKDRSEDLKKYKFNKNGYEIRISGVVGYRIKEGSKKDAQLLLKYKQRIKEIEELSKSERNIFEFINKDFPNAKSKTLEGKIIEYVRENYANQSAIDLLLAYQLHGQYDQFIRESNDRTDMYEKMEGKEYVMLSELSERYGDLMKETLKGIAKKVSESEDKDFFLKNISGDIEKAEKLSGKIYNELLKIPENKLTTETIQKKVAKSIQNAFQQNVSIKSISESFSASFTKENLDSFENIFKSKTKEIFQEVDSETTVDIQKLEIIRQKTYEEIKNELDKYEEIKEVDEERKGEVKMPKERLIKGYFSKNRENAHARMIGDICIASNPKMLENKNYFDFVLFDEDRKKCVGTCMLLNMEEPGARKYLLYCPNPSVDLVSQVSAERLYKLITTKVIDFALNNNFDGVLLDKRHGHATNRSGLFQTTLEKSVVRNDQGEEVILNLKNEHQLSGNYVYKEKLNAVWLKDR